MSWWMALVYDTVMGPAERACLTPWRRALLRGARGSVLEIGAGTGANLPLYPPGLTALVLAEPDAAMRTRLARRLAAQGSNAVMVDWPAEALQVPGASLDVVVSTLVLCSVGDPLAAAKELHRVLKPQGVLLFMEHVAAQDHPGRLRWQHRIEPAWKHLGRELSSHPGHRSNPWRSRF